MSTSNTDTAPEVGPNTARRRDNSQFFLVGLLLVLAAIVAIDASGLRNDFAQVDPIGPKVFPFIVAAGLAITAVILAIAVWRGSVPAAEEGEDVDLSQKTDWMTVVKLVGCFIFLIATVNLLGWVISAGLFFAGCAMTLGSRTWFRDLVIGAVMSTATFYLFYSGLGVPLPAGILDGIL